MALGKKHFNTYSIVLCAVFAALIAAGAFIRIPVYPVPVTLQLEFVLLAGLMAGSKRGAVSVMIYISIGLMGLPVFARGGGIGYVLQPTFGYIIGFVFAAFTSGRIIEKSTGSLKSYLTASLAGLLIVYFTGLVYFYLISGFYLNKDIGIRYLLLNCFLITLPADIIFGFTGAVLAKRLKPATSKYLS